MSKQPQKPFCSTCTFKMGSKEQKECCENRVYWTEKFDSIKDSEFMRGPPLPKLNGYSEYVKECEKEFEENNKV